LHRYYVSAPLQQARRVPATPDAVRRIAAGELKRLLRDELAPRMRFAADANLQDILPAIHRIEIEARSARVTSGDESNQRNGFGGAGGFFIPPPYPPSVTSHIILG
jgi:hypothetical protein